MFHFPATYVVALIKYARYVKRSYDVYRIIAVMLSGDRYHAIRREAVWRPLSCHQATAMCVHAFRVRTLPRHARRSRRRPDCVVNALHALTLRALDDENKKGRNGCSPFHSGSVFQT